MAKTTTKLVWDIEPGDILIGDAGGQSWVDDKEVSSAMPGLIRVHTEHGHLYMDPEAEVTVLV
jgi:hypothetical protein